MALQLAPEEPEAAPWRAELLSTIADAVTRRRPDRGSSGRPAVLAVDGRSNNGKTTVAARIGTLVQGAVVIHTDDIAFEHSRFGWADLLIDGILVPAHQGRAVRYRPPKWDEHGREGSLDVPAGCPLLIIEGDGAGRRGSGAPDRHADLGASRRPAGRTALRRTGGQSAPPPTWSIRPLMELRSIRKGGWPKKYLSTPPSGPGNAPTSSCAAPRRFLRPQHRNRHRTAITPAGSLQ